MTATAGGAGGDAANRRQVRRVLLVDDHPIVRKGLRRLIGNEPDLEVCAEVEGVREARNAVREHRPDAVVVDLSLKDGDGMDLVRDLRAHDPALPLLVLSMHDEAVFARRLLAAGANGYIMKQAASEQFIQALRQVLAGATYVSDAVGYRLGPGTTRGVADAAGSPIERLSNRELQVLQMIGRGQSSRQMAEALNLSVKTIEAHRQRIKRKLGLTTGAQLVNYAASWTAGH